jgi:hypothetical protein
LHCSCALTTVCVADIEGGQHVSSQVAGDLCSSLKVHMQDLLNDIAYKGCIGIFFRGNSMALDVIRNASSL